MLEISIMMRAYSMDCHRGFGHFINPEIPAWFNFESDAAAGFGNCRLPEYRHRIVSAGAHNH